MDKIQIFIILAISFLAFCFGIAFANDNIEETDEDIKLVNDALLKAEKYIWSQIDESTGLWPNREAAIAILGILAERTGINGLSGYGKENEIELIKRNLAQVHLNFFLEMKRNNFELSSLSDTALSHTISVMRLSCDKNPTDYFGYNLIEEVNRRLEVHIKKQNMNQYTDPPLSFPVMALLACNNKDVSIFDKYKLKLIFPMSIKSYDNEKVYPMGVERAALNTMAIRCYQNHLSEVEDTNKFKRLLFNVASRNLNYIKSMQKSDGGFDNTIYCTSLAIHADLSSQIGLESAKFDFAKARKWLVNSQKEDGSFGSLTFTSLAIGGLVERSVDLIKNINCNKPNKKEEEFGIPIEIADAVSKVSFFNRIPAHHGDSLLAILENYASNNPKVLRLKIDKSDFGSKIESINDLGSSEDAKIVWKVLREKNREGVDNVLDLEEETVEEGVGYIFQYS